MHIFGHSRDLVKHITESVANHRLGIIIDAASSRLKVSSNYLDIAKQIITDSGATKFACIIVIASRIDLMDAMYKRSQVLFSKGTGARVVVTLGCGAWHHFVLKFKCSYAYNSYISSSELLGIAVRAKPRMQITSGASQGAKTLPFFLILIHHDSKQSLPFAVDMPRNQSRKLEQARLRCMTRDCPLRSEAERALLVCALVQ